MVRKIFVLCFLLFSFNSSFGQIPNWVEIGDFQNITGLEVINNDTIFVAEAGNTQGIYRSWDFGITWDTLDYPSTFSHPGIFNYCDGILYCFGSGSMCKSTDLGETWRQIYTRVENTKYSVSSASGDIIIGAAAGRLGVSADSGETWTRFYFSDNTVIYDMEIDSSGILYVASRDFYLNMTSDYGQNWSTFYDSNVVTSFEIDEEENFYMTTYNDVYVSHDKGESWINLEYPSLHPDGVQIDPLKNIYVYNNYNGGVYKKTNVGWELICPKHPRELKVVNEEIVLTVFKNSDWDYGLYLYDSTYIPETGNNFLPLEVGNSWEQMRTFHSSPDPVSDYELIFLTVDADTLIGTNKFFKIDGFSENWTRYDDSLKTINIFDDGAEHIYVDFSKFEEEVYNSYSPITLRYYEVEVEVSTQQLFGELVKCKGFTQYGWDYSQTVLFAENIGFFKTTGSGPGGGGTSSGTKKTIQYKLIDSNGVVSNHPHSYYPEYQLTPLTIISDSDFNLNFIVDHEYTRFGSYLGVPDDGVNYIEQVTMEYFYQYDDISTEPEFVSAINEPLTRNYSIQVNLDTTLFYNGYDLKYRFIATEIGILPKTSTSPDTGYYTCVYDPTVSVKEIEEIPKEFSLSQNYPNPFNPVTKIKFTIPVGNEHLRSLLTVYDILGNKIATLVNEQKQPGIYEVEFNGSNLASGIYFYRLEAGEFKKIKKMLLIK